MFQSNEIDFYYYQDEPGFASSKPEVFELSTGDTIERFTSPGWGLDVKSGKGNGARFKRVFSIGKFIEINFFPPFNHQAPI